MARTGASRVKGGQVQVEGLAELQKAMRRMGESLKDLTAINREAARLVYEASQPRVPVRSGKLRKSGRAGATKSKGYVAYGGRDVPYAGPIHFGWFSRNIDPNPFVYDALDSRKDEVVRRYEEQVGDLVKRLDRETPG